MLPLQSLAASHVTSTASFATNLTVDEAARTRKEAAIVQDLTIFESGILLGHEHRELVM